MTTVLTPTRTDYLLLAARLGLASLFLFSGTEKLLDINGAAGFAASHGIPFAKLIIPFVVVFEIGAALCLVTGWRLRTAAAALAVWSLILGPWFHRFWETPPPMWQMMIDDFFHHFVMAGGLIYAAVLGPGALTVKRWFRPAPPAV